MITAPGGGEGVHPTFQASCPATEPGQNLFGRPFRAHALDASQPQLLDHRCLHRSEVDAVDPEARSVRRAPQGEGERGESVLAGGVGRRPSMGLPMLTDPALAMQPSLANRSQSLKERT